MWSRSDLILPASDFFAWRLAAGLPFKPQSAGHKGTRTVLPFLTRPRHTISSKKLLEERGRGINKDQERCDWFKSKGSAIEPGTARRPSGESKARKACRSQRRSAERSNLAIKIQALSSATPSLPSHFSKPSASDPDPKPWHPQSLNHNPFKADRILLLHASTGMIEPKLRTCIGAR